MAPGLGEESGETGSDVGVGTSKCPTSTQAPSSSPHFPVHSDSGRGASGRGCGGSGTSSCLVESPLRSPQEGLSEDEISSRCESVESAYSDIQVQNDHYNLGQRDSSPILVSGLHRLKRRVLARPDKQSIQTLPGIFSRQADIPVSGSSIRTQHRTKGLYQDASACSRPSSHRGREHPDVSRRLASVCSDTPAMRPDGEPHSSDRCGDGVFVQFGKIIPSPDTVLDVARDDVGHHHFFPVAVERQPEEVQEPNCQGHSLYNNDPAPVGEPDGLVEPCGLSDSSGPFEDPSSPLRRDEDLHGQGQGHPCVIPSAPKEISEMVVQTRPHCSLGVMDQPSFVHHPDDGRLRQGLGVPVVTRAPRPRPLDSFGSDVAHQLEGVDDDMVGTRKGKRPSPNLHISPVRQHYGSVLPQQTGYSQVGCSPSDVREDIGRSSCTPTDYQGSPPSGGEQYVGGRTFAGFDQHCQLVDHAQVLRDYVRLVGHSTCGPLCVHHKPPTPSIPNPLGGNPGRRPGCTPSQLESMGIHLPVSASEYSDDASGGEEAREVQRQSSPHSSLLGDPAVVPGPSGAATRDSPSSKRLPPPGVFMSIDDISALNRLDFLRQAHEKLGTPKDTAEDLIKGHRSSTRRQYESGWKKFQCFVKATKVTRITPAVLIAFASDLFHKSDTISPATVNNAMVAIRDPVSFGFNVEVNARSWELLQRSFFNQRPPARPDPPSWSLKKVLTLLQTNRFTYNPSTEDILMKALFLTALATGHRVSQLAALQRGSQFMQFGQDDSFVTLKPKPRFLAKNERPGHRLTPANIPAWFDDTGNHALCPVAALKEYLLNTNSYRGADLWVDHTLTKTLKPKDLASLLVKLIDLADPQSKPKAHQVRAYASTLAFFKSFDVEEVREAGQWSSSYSFLTRYLQAHLENIPCVAMGSTPSSYDRFNTVGGD